MGYLEDYRARQRAEAAAAKAAASTNGQEPEQPAAATRSTQSDETYRGDGSAYVAAGVDKQLEILRRARAGTERTRNTTLYVSAKCLAQLGVDRKDLRRRLLEACESLPEGNGLIDEDGEPQCRKTIASGYRNADKEGPREYTSDYIDRCNVEEVPMSAFTAEDLDDDDDEQPATNTAAPGLASVTSIAGGGSAGQKQQSTPAGKDKSAQAATNRRARELLKAIYAVEADFWQRDSLSYVYDCALMRMAPPWSVLANCVARALVLVGARVKLPATIGGKGSLNWFGVVASPSGKGKSSSAAVGADLIKGSQIDSLVRSIGSGEGILAQYRPPGRNPADHNELMFLCEEIDTLTAMRDRTSSTVTSVLCNGFMGDPIGHSYRNNAGQRPLERHGYRMTVIVGAQPGRAGGLLEDRYSGILQRFQWFPAFDTRCTRARARPGELFSDMQIPQMGAWNVNNCELTLPGAVTEEILIEHEKRIQGDGDALDGHIKFIQAKFALALAVLDNRQEIDEADWRLAGIAMEVSTLTRAWVELEWAAAEADNAARRGRPIGMVQSAAGVAKAEADEEKMRQCARRIRNKLTKGPATRKQLQTTAGMTKRWFEAALDTLIAGKVIEAVVDRNGRPMFALVSKP